jgi:FlaA1/EpsC-like NDP-sugar epimerase
MENLLKNKIVLVTGGTGSIGREIVKKILKFDPKQIRIFSRDQSKQLYLQYELEDHQKVRYLIGDIRDRERLSLAMQDVNIVFHAAALKHVASCEYNPFEAVKTNVLGLQNVIDEAIKNKVERFVYISTDKAANPIGVMGSTKALGEKLVSNAYYYQGDGNTIFSSVRFGNVLGSEGSVVPIFKNQIKKGFPITITDTKMKRFFMSISQAAELTLQALKHSQVNEIFVLKMPTMKILDLAESIIEEISPNKEAEIKIVGRKEGEKIDEQLMTKDEARNAIETKEFFIIRPELLIPFKEGHLAPYSPSEDLEIKESEEISYDTAKANLLSKVEIKEILRNANII